VPGDVAVFGGGAAVGVADMVRYRRLGANLL